MRFMWNAAWGRIEGKEAIAHWLEHSMIGLGHWKFPVEFTAIEGNDVVVKWTQIIPGRRADGTPYAQSAYSRLRYAGGGRFDYQEDTYNMVHVLEDMAASRWRPTEPMNVPPEHPVRNWAPPGGSGTPAGGGVEHVEELLGLPGPGHGCALERPGPGWQRRPGQGGLHLVHEPVTLGGDDGRVEVPEAGHRGGHHRATEGHELPGLDRIEALDEGVDLMGHDQDVGVLEVGGQVAVGAGAQNDGADTASDWVVSRVRLLGPTNTRWPPPAAPGQRQAQIHVQSAGAQRALIEDDPGVGQVGRARCRRPEVFDVDAVLDEVHRTHLAAAGRRGPASTRPPRWPRCSMAASLRRCRSISRSGAVPNTQSSVMS